MELKEVVYQKRPLKKELDETTKTLIDVLNMLVPEVNTHWSFSGGFARDTYLDKPFNDYDVCMNNYHTIINRLDEMGLIERGVAEGDEIPHDYYVDPYSFSKKKYPIHWIQADNDWAYAPQHFDFSINQICLKPDGYFYAPTYTWRDLDRKVIRKVADRMTSNIAMRAVRFAAKYGFTIHEDLVKEIKKTVMEPMDTILLMRNANKMIEDDVGPQSLAIMKELQFPFVEFCETMEDYIKIQNDAIIDGSGYREPVRHTGYF
jgi:hypothetical protein